jgi:hypothetical protein
MRNNVFMGIGAGLISSAYPGYNLAYVFDLSAGVFTTSCLLCNFAIAHIFLVISAILRIEGQINRIYIPDNWGWLFIISMLLTWLIHHALWTRLSDK